MKSIQVKWLLIAIIGILSIITVTLCFRLKKLNDTVNNLYLSNSSNDIKQINSLIFESHFKDDLVLSGFNTSTTIIITFFTVIIALGGYISFQKIEKDIEKLKESATTIEETANEVKKAKSIIEKTANEVKEAKSKIDKTTKEVQDAKSKIEETASEVEDAKIKIEETASEVEDAKIKIEETATDVKETELKLIFLNIQEQQHAIGRYSMLTTQYCTEKTNSTFDSYFIFNHLSSSYIKLEMIDRLISTIDTNEEFLEDFTTQREKSIKYIQKNQEILIKFFINNKKNITDINILTLHLWFISLEKNITINNIPELKDDYKKLVDIINKYKEEKNIHL
ncbi:coiled-coil domain-containing protein [Myroides odoratimimus]|uniref:coiled-coil domain-containing protein n=1 Tax=Myroides odoratimimus TaxID=76832 RepID=UPI0025768FCC|nr:hypothetical protein [Myroides odoratimimus]MDM1535077.1 hypothetical protein [Myroides odoratimimus]MDM1674165.1 hypothetical protein [Myroides odoratimimus]